MADALQVFQFIYPAGNGSAVSFRNQINLGPCTVTRILMTFPPGTFGQVGGRVEAGGGFAFPSMPGQFVTFDDYTYPIDVTNQIDNGNWAVVAYNTDAIEHEIQWVFEYNYLRGTQSQSQLQPIAL